MTLADLIAMPFGLIIPAFLAAIGAIAYCYRLRPRKAGVETEQIARLPALQQPRDQKRQVMWYRTRSESLNFYRFSFEEQPDGRWWVYILDQPDYCGRDDSRYTTHRGCDGGRYYISPPAPLRTFEQAKAVAAMWAEATDRYILKGSRF